MKRIIAAIILLLLLVVPFINWRLGAILWMSAWLMFILQKLFSRREWNLGEVGDGSDNAENEDEEQG